VLHKTIYLQPLEPEGTQRPVEPLTLQTSCFKLLLGAQQLPVGTGRPAFWGEGAAKAMEVRRAMAPSVTFMIANLVVEMVVLMGCGPDQMIDKLLEMIVGTEPAEEEVKRCED
jgi:hypothetical protein